MKPSLFIWVAIHFFMSPLFSQAAGDYRSAATGNWNVNATWETFNGTAWVAAGATPTSANGVITIRSPHTVTIPTATTVNFDQLTVDVGGTLLNTGTSTVTVANGAGTDLIINGTYYEDGTNSITFTGTWSFGANGTLIKTRGSASNNWQGAYEGGIVNIPATSNWIIRKVAAANPTISTIGAYYGNLIIENNNAGLWTVPAASSFQGITGFPTIKGNLDIGGSGSSTVSFINQHTNANPTLVIGNVLVRSGNIFQNNGTGLEIQGNLTVNGTISYDANDGRNLNFTGGNAQTINNTGTLAIYNFTINKPANALTLNSPIIVDNTATFTSGNVNSSLTNLFILNMVAVPATASNASFVNGPVRYLGSSVMTFPVGKTSSYRPIITGSGASGPFWTEPFNSTCSSNCILTTYSGPNGSWTFTNTGTNGASANNWYISGSECGNAAGICGSACGTTDASLYLSAVLLNGGLGAAYNASGAANVTNKRAESPVINLTGRNNVQLSFNFIGNGQGCATDYCDLEYSSDGGSTWSTLQGCLQSSLCGSGQGRWTAYSILLPTSANNNPNVKIGFRWSNNGDGIGTDPSFAVDDIVLSIPSSFTAEYFPNNPQVPYGNLLAPTLTNLSDCEYWILNRDAGNDSRTVGLTWNTSTCYNSAYASFEVARYDGISTWQDHDGAVSGTAASGTVTTPAVVSSFSPFAIAYVPLPLPVELLSFSAECKDNRVNIKWSTASEQNNSHFIIEKSTDAITWEETFRMAGAGNSNSIRNYEWSDPDPSEIAYYRLIQADFDGTYKIYDPSVVHCFSMSPSVNVYPNPAENIIYIRVPGGADLKSAELFSLQGQFLHPVSIPKATGNTLIPTDVSMLNPGTYYLRLLVNNEYVTKPIVIVR